MQWFLKRNRDNLQTCRVIGKTIDTIFNLLQQVMVGLWVPPADTRKEPCEPLWKQQRRTLEISPLKLTTNDLREARVFFSLKDSKMPQASSEVWYSLALFGELYNQSSGPCKWDHGWLCFPSTCGLSHQTVNVLRSSQKSLSVSGWQLRQRDNTSLTEGWERYRSPIAPAMLSVADKCIPVSNRDELPWKGYLLRGGLDTRTLSKLSFWILKKKKANDLNLFHFSEHLWGILPNL